MDNKKDIGKVFKEELGDFKKSPDNLIWNDIEKELDKSKDPKRFYWLLLTSLAALFMGLTVMGVYTFRNSKNNNKLQHTDSITHQEQQETCEEVITQTEKKITPNINKTASSRKEIKDTPLLNTTKPNAYTTQETSSTNNKLANNIISKKNKKTKANTKLNITKSDSYKTKEKQLNTSQENSAPDYKLANNINSKRNQKTTAINSGTTLVENNDYQSKNEGVKTKTTETVRRKKNTDTTISNRLKQLVASDNIEKTKNDTLGISATNKKEEILKKAPKDSLISPKPVKNTMFDGLNLGVHVIPTYTIPRDGSLISTSLSNNTEGSAFTMNYGVVLTGYATDRVSIRAGYNNIKINSKINNIVSQTLPSVLLAADILVPNTIIQNITNQETVNLTQEVQYHELSLALGYKIIDKRFDWSIIGGASLLLLQKDKITLHSGATTFNLGMNANLESTNTSLNFGSNLRYRLFKNIYFKVEPIINYHFSNASKNQGSYKPFYLSIQSGLSIDF